MEAWKEELYHHGIKGQRWGIRRFQNFDGSYTKRGLQRYNEARENYDRANDTVKGLKKAKKELGNRTYDVGDGTTMTTREMIREGKALRKERKQELNKQYKQLKYDKLADEGKELYKRGERIRPTNAARNTRQGIVSVAAVAAGYYYKEINKGKSISVKGMKIPMEVAAPATIMVGGTAVNKLLSLPGERKNKRLSAYYAH